MPTHSGRESALELLLEQPARLESGLVVLDRRLPLDESVEVDALLRDSLGYPVVVLFSKGEIAQELGRMAAVVAGLQRGRYLLARLYADKGLDASLRPRFVLLGARFADDASALLDMMGGVEVHALEFRVVTGNNGQQVLDLVSFHRTSGPSVVKSGWRGAELSSAPAAAASAASSSAAPATASAASAAGSHTAPGATSHTVPSTTSHTASGAGWPAAPGVGAGAASPASASAASSVAAGSAPVARPAAPAVAAASFPDAGSLSSSGAPASAGSEYEQASASRVAVSHGNGNGNGRELHVAERSARSHADQTGDLQVLDSEPSPADLARGYFMRARDSIRSLSIHVSENPDHGGLRYRVADAELATLSLDAAGFHVQVGALGGRDGAVVKVTDEASFNESLNAVFMLYFNRLGPDRPTA